MRKKKTSIISSIMRLCIIVIVITAVVIGYVGIQSIKMISSAAFHSYEAAMDHGYKDEIKSQVQGTISILQSEYDKFQAGEKTEEEAKNDAKEIIRAMRYRDDQSGYFWIDDTDYILVMHPILVDKEGANRYDLQDPNGVMIVQSIMSVCQTPEKGGYNEFYFTKADGVTVAPKIAYSQIFEPWGWVVSTGNYVDEIEIEKNTTRELMGTQYGRMLVNIIVVFVVTIAIGIAISYVLGKKMVAPLKKIQVFAGEIAEGNLTSSVEIDQNNEIGQTATELMTAQGNIRVLLQEITDVAHNITNALNNFDNSFHHMSESIGQVSSAVGEIAENITQQAASTDDAGKDVLEIADKIKHTGEEVELLNHNTNDMNQVSVESVDTLRKLIEKNKTTQDNILDMAQQTEKTNESVQQIQVAANLINEIADQTALLALNASIEAARAGEAGKGFAVVADEIAKLASQSATSVEEINQIVNDLQRNAHKSVEVMKDINVSVNEQVDTLTDTQHIIDSLHKELGNCANSVKAIDTMTIDLERQRVSVTHSLDTLNQIAQDNAAVAEQTAAMAEEMSQSVDESGKVVVELRDKANMLIQNVGKFTL